MEKGYSSIKMYPDLRLQVFVHLRDDNEIVAQFVDYTIDYKDNFRIFISIPNTGEFVFLAEFDNYRISKKVKIGKKKKIKFSDDEELQFFLDNFEHFLKAYLQKIQGVIPEQYVSVINEIISKI